MTDPIENSRLETVIKRDPDIETTMSKKIVKRSQSRFHWYGGINGFYEGQMWKTGSHNNHDKL